MVLIVQQSPVVKRPAEMNGLSNGASHVDPAFHGAGQQPGLEIWRIEKMAPVRQDAKLNGKFYNGDCYIVLHTSSGTPRAWNVHFWLGSKSSQDEQGAAAIKTVELDDSMGGAPIQYREVQGNESKLFLSYFRSGLRYLEGGVESGFKHVDRDAFEKRLYHIKGKRNSRVKQVPIARTSLNQGDVFMLDDGRNIYVWMGPNSSKSERRKGLGLARELRDEDRAGKASVHVIEENWNSDADFFTALGEAPGYIKTADEGGDDSAFEQRHADTIKLYKVSDASGRLETSQITKRPLSKEMLDSNDCFILDLGVTGIFAWVGKACTTAEKTAVWKMATDFLKKQGYPKSTPVCRLAEGTENALFKQAMHWPQDPLTPTATSTVGRNVAKIDPNDHIVDVNALHTRQEEAAEATIDDGTGEKLVWRIEKMFLRPIDKLDYGTFYAGDSYVILYTYLVNGLKKGIVYFWQGSKSSKDEKAASAMMASHVDDKEFDGQAVQVRVVMGKEPKHFIKISGNQLIILMGGHASGFKNCNDSDSYDTDGTRMFQIHDNKIIQVPERASSLNSNDMFILETPSRTYIWHGEGASSEEKSLSTEFAKLVIPLKKPTIVREHDEDQDFWDSLGGKAKYASDEQLKTVSPSFVPRLFHCTNAVGYFKVEEIADFNQDDLIEDDVMLLDTGSAIFIWVGMNANEEEKKQAMKTAMDYLETDPMGRSEQNTSILILKQGFEPLAFTGYFAPWDNELWNSGKSYEELKKEVGEENSKVQTVSEVMELYSKTYPIEQLLDLENLPEGVDPSKREDHLSDQDFEGLFRTSRQSYSKLPKWKQLQLKKFTKLF